jgi:predicted nucleic acid-binding protein
MKTITIRELLHNPTRTFRVVIPPVDWEVVHAEAERLSNAHTPRRGYRALDVLHVAPALTLGAKVLLTFDSEQAALAKAAGLRVKP